MQPYRYDTVLVAIMNHPRDLAIARDEHWYRIPVQQAPSRGVHAPILAFYQTKAFGEQRWSIQHYAHTTAWEAVRRVELLPNEPQHPRANELYYKVHLAELHALPHPIVSRKWRRITFIITHWERLLAAQEIGELLHGSIWEERLWTALRKLGRLAEADACDLASEDDFGDW
jgi:hypothetical protein